MFRFDNANTLHISKRGLRPKWLREAVAEVFRFHLLSLWEEEADLDLVSLEKEKLIKENVFECFPRFLSFNPPADENEKGARAAGASVQVERHCFTSAVHF